MSFPREQFLKEAATQKKSANYITETLAYADALDAKGLPVIFSTRHLATGLDLPIHELNKLIQDRSYYYKLYTIKKRGGGVRQISAPYSNLKPVLSWLNQEILAKIPVSDAAFGFVQGRSIAANAFPHQSKKFILNIDLLKFFDSISEYRVYDSLVKIGYHTNLSRDLATLMTLPIKEDYFDTFSDKEQKLFNRLFLTETGVLPQGAPTSPALSNIIAKGLDEALLALAAERGLTYTRYADDITFSANEYDRLPKFNELGEIIRAEGFFVNWNKANIYKRGSRQLVTGLTVTSGVHVPKSYRKDVARHIHFCLTCGPEDHTKRLGMDDKHFYKEWLKGRILYIKSIEPKTGLDLLSQFEKINWPF